MSKITKSRAKLEAFEEARERDRKAVEIMEREGCSFSEAVARVMDEEELKL